MALRGSGSGGRLGAALACATVVLLAAAPAANASGTPGNADPGGLYVALGDSVAWGYGASSPSKSYVGLLFSHYQSTLGVTQLSNRAVLGETSGSMLGPGRQLEKALADVNGSSDTRAVTIDIGGNDGLGTTCTDKWDSCPFRGNFATALSKLREALAADPGDETFIAMAYYNPASGLGGTIEPYYDRQLLGSDHAIECAITTGPKVGGNDVIFQEAGRYGAGVANPYSAFKTGGQALMSDGIHPNDAGYAAIADAFRHPSARCAPGSSAPETTITDSPPHRTRSHQATFEFRSSKPHSSFQCSLDRKRFKACEPPKTYRRLNHGRHIFKVRALSRAGTPDASPAKWRWRIR